MGTYNKISSSDIGIILKVLELSRRYGLRSSETEAFLSYQSDPSENGGKMVLKFEGYPFGAQKQEQWHKMMDAIGCSSGPPWQLIADCNYDMEDVLDAALQKAPRARSV
jgi:hypothetical protein